eukprot:SAG31_NODE_721_length_12587_cov_5.502002_8_plen_38_part_00
MIGASVPAEWHARRAGMHATMVVVGLAGAAAGSLQQS